MLLSELKTGERAVIVKVAGQGGFRKRLVEMGFVYGKTVTVILNAPLKDPIEYQILGYKVSLRRSEASKIEVISEEEARVQITQHEDFSALVPDECDGEYISKAMEHIADERHREIRVALVGNPNCGKTSLFNAASGSHEHVGNYSGVTVDAKEGAFEYGGYKFVLVDLPGTYSLSEYSPEELYVRKSLIENQPDVVLNVVDASNLERNPYLTTQLIDMHLQLVMALNMYDELMARGDRLDTMQLGYLLGMPVCPTVSRTGEGVNELFDTVIKVYENHGDALARHLHVNHGKELEKSIKRLRDLIWQNDAVKSRYSSRYLAIKTLDGDKDIRHIIDSLPNRDEIIAAKVEEGKRIEALMDANLETALVDAKYAFVQGALAETYKPKPENRESADITDRIDAIVTNKWLAFPIFIAVLFLMFEATFSLGQYPMDWIDALVGKIGELASLLMKDGWLKAMVVDGIIGGVGSVLVFLPNILILYFFISLMEDSGYMARTAFIMDKLMHKIGLHGKSFIPMVMGFGCNVPAIMATRTIESRRSRLITMAIIPFMSCSGRLPVFVLFCSAFFPGYAAPALLGIYFIGVVVAVASAFVFGKFIKEDDLPFVMELPPYRVPTAKAIGRHTWEKGAQYLQKIGSTILIASIIIWALGYFPRNDDPVLQQENSYIALVGKAVSPIMEPMDFDWKMNVGLLTGVAAKELTVSSLGVMYAQDAGTAAQSDSPVSLQDSSDEASSGTSSGANQTQLQSALKKSVSTPSAVAYMVFVLLYFPCIATFAAIKNESGKWRWAIAICIYTIAVAWLLSFLAYRIALML